MLLHPPTPLSSLLTPVTHPQDLHPLWSQLTDEHTWKQTLLNRLQLLFHSCVYRIIRILNLIPKWEPTGWVRTPGFSARAVEEVTQHSSSEVLQDGKQPSGGLTPVRLRLVLMQCLGADGTHRSWVRRHMNCSGGTTNSIQNGPRGSPLPSFLHPSLLGKALPAGAGALRSWTHLCEKFSTLSQQHPEKMEGAEQTENWAWDTDAKKVSKGKGREKLPNSGIITVQHWCHKQKEVCWMFYFVCEVNCAFRVWINLFCQFYYLSDIKINNLKQRRSGDLPSQPGLVRTALTRE